MGNIHSYNKDIIILALETSCDETAAAIVKNGTDVLSSVVVSQIDIHSEFGGVVPEIASREHIAACDIVVDKALKEASLQLKDIDFLAVTYGPGLVGALLTGVSFMKALSYSSNKKLIPVNHIHGHIFANFLNDKKPSLPFICLVASGGHSHIVIVNQDLTYKIVGRTVDDAAGEAFDKAARVLGLSYPGGPNLSKLAMNGNPNAIELPNPKLDSPYDFSFSGLKTAFINAVHKLEQNNKIINKDDFAASFEEKVSEILVSKTIKAALDNNLNQLCVAGGVSANRRLREKFEQRCKQENITLYLPNLLYCTDNAAMIGAAAYFEAKKNNFANLNLNAVPNLKI